MTTQTEAIARALDLYGGNRPLCVAEIGSQSCWLRERSPHPRNLYLSGPMGLASSVALGVALSRPSERVLAICGDGSLAMNFSSLITIRHARPANLCLLVIANDTYEFTASLPSPSGSLDWRAAGASIFGEGACRLLDDASPDLVAAGSGPVMLVAKVGPSPKAAPPLGLSPGEIRAAFRAALAAAS